MDPIFQILFNPFAGPAGLNLIACVVWCAIIALLIQLAVEVKS